MTIGARINSALRTIPDRSAWARMLFEAGWSLPLAMLLCFVGGLMSCGWTDDPTLLLRLVFVALIAPALGEELLFRVIMLPPPDQPSPWWRQAIPVLLFVAWHPPQVLVFGPHLGGGGLEPLVPCGRGGDGDGADPALSRHRLDLALGSASLDYGHRLESLLRSTLALGPLIRLPRAALALI
jgi:hypothetical protein